MKHMVLSKQFKNIIILFFAILLVSASIYDIHKNKEEYKLINKKNHQIDEEKRLFCNWCPTK